MGTWVVGHVAPRVRASQPLLAAGTACEDSGSGCEDSQQPDSARGRMAARGVAGGPPWYLVDNNARLHVVTSREHLHAVGKEFNLGTRNPLAKGGFSYGNLEKLVGLNAGNGTGGHVFGWVHLRAMHWIKRDGHEELVPVVGGLNQGGLAYFFKLHTDLPFGQKELSELLRGTKRSHGQRITCDAITRPGAVWRRAAAPSDPLAHLPRAPPPLGFKDPEALAPAPRLVATIAPPPPGANIRLQLVLAGGRPPPQQPPPRRRTCRTRTI